MGQWGTLQPVQGDNSAKRNRNPTSAWMYHRLLGRNWQPRNLLSECPEFAMQHYPATAEALVHRTSSWSGLEALGWCCGYSISFGSWNAVVNPGLEGWNLQMDNDSIYNQDRELLKHILIRAWWSQSRMQHFEHSDADTFGGMSLIWMSDQLGSFNVSFNLIHVFNNTRWYNVAIDSPWRFPSRYWDWLAGKFHFFDKIPFSAAWW